MPERKDGYRYSNSDPVSGQAAWYDLRVRIEKCSDEDIDSTDPLFDTLPAREAPREGGATLRYGAEFKSAPSGRTGGDHLEFIGNRTEVAETVAGVPSGHGNQKKEDV